MKQIVGFVPYSGTLNIRLSENGARLRRSLEKMGLPRVLPAEGYRSGIVLKACIGDLECAVVIPEVVGYPDDVLEIIAPVNLRETLGLVDGDELSIVVST
jgi:riboflavin kinase